MRRRYLMYKHTPIVAVLLFAGCLAGFASGWQLRNTRPRATMHPVSHQITTVVGDIGTQAAAATGASHSIHQPTPVSHPVSYAPRSLPATTPPHHKHHDSRHADHGHGKHRQQPKDDGPQDGSITVAAIPANVETVAIAIP